MVEAQDPYGDATNVPIVPDSWLDRAIAKLLADANSTTHANAVSLSPVKRINGVEPDIFGNVRVNPGNVTPAQLSVVLQQVFEAGDNVKVVVDPESGRVRINAHTIGSVWTVNGHCGHVTITKADLGLDRVDNTSDAEKPVSNPTRAAIEKVITDTATKIEKVRTEVITYVDDKLGKLRTDVNTQIANLTNIVNTKQDKGWVPKAEEIPGLSTLVRTTTLNRWGNWTPVPLTNGWTGQVYAITDGQTVILRGRAYPGTSNTFGRLPFGFPVVAHTAGYGEHVVANPTTGREMRITRVTADNGVLSTNGYASALDGIGLDGVTFVML